MSDLRRRTMMARASGGGGARTESGSFTVTSGYITSKDIEHGLNTTNLFGVIWLEPDENNQIVAPGGYTLIFGHFITVDFAKALYEGTEIVQNYTSHATKTKEYPVPDKILLRRYRSTWSNSAAGWDETGQVAYVGNIWGTAISKNEFRIATSSVNTFMRAGTYHWQVWALDDWVGGK